MKKILNSISNVGKVVAKTCKLLITSSIVILGTASIWGLKHDVRITIVANK